MTYGYVTYKDIGCPSGAQPQQVKESVKQEAKEVAKKEVSKEELKEELKERFLYYKMNRR